MSTSTPNQNKWVDAMLASEAEECDKIAPEDLKTETSSSSLTKIFDENSPESKEASEILEEVHAQENPIPFHPLKAEVEKDLPPSETEYKTEKLLDGSESWACQE